MTPAQIEALFGRAQKEAWVRLVSAVGEIPVYDEFCGWGGLSQGATAVPGVKLMHAANHTEICIEVIAANHPHASTYCGDVRSIDVAKFPYYPLFLAAPQCPPFSSASGKRQNFDQDTQGVLWEDEKDAKTDERKRGRLLMHEVPRYLEGMALRGKKVLAGVVENVPQARRWASWDAWIKRIQDLGYDVKVIAFNSMHARPVRSRWAPQSRDRLYVAYWLRSLGRAPDWDKWLRPRAWCPVCEETVDAMQVFKKPGDDMGTFGRQGQYWYRCPHRSCRNAIVYPDVMPAGAIIDWSDPGTPVGDRPGGMAASTRARIEAGIRKYAMPILAEVAGHTFERRPGVRTRGVDQPTTTQSCTASKALAWDPLIVPTGGTWRDTPTSAADPIPTRTTRENDGVAIPPFITVHHGRGGDPRTGEVTSPLSTVSAQGNHHGVAVPPFITVMRGDMDVLAPGDPLTTISTKGGHHGLAIPPFIMPMRSGRLRSSSVGEPVATVMANGSGQYLVNPDAALIMRNNNGGAEMSTPIGEPVRTVTGKGHQSVVSWKWEDLLVPYYGTGRARPVSSPAGTFTAKDRFGLARIEDLPVNIDEVLFRMLKPEEIALAMAFAEDYIVMGTREQRIRGYGNAVTPPVGEVIVSALVEAMTGVDLPRDLGLAA